MDQQYDLILNDMNSTNKFEVATKLAKVFYKDKHKLEELISKLNIYISSHGLWDQSKKEMERESLYEKMSLVYTELGGTSDKLLAEEKSEIQRSLSSVNTKTDLADFAAKISRSIQAEDLKEPEDGLDHSNIEEFFVEIDKVEKHNGYTTLFPVIDEELGGGMERGQHTVIVGTTNGGKSMLALSLALHYIENNGLRVMYLNAEDEKKNIVRRIIAYRSGIKNKEIKQGLYHIRELGKEVPYDNASAWTKNLFKDQKFSLRPFGMNETRGALKLIDETDYDVCIVENLDCLVSPGPADRYDKQLASIVETLNNIAKRKNKLIISLHQAGSKANAIVEDKSKPLSSAIAQINLENCMAESHYAIQAKVHTLLLYAFRQEDPNLSNDLYNGYSGMKIMKQKNGAKYIHEECYANLDISRVRAERQDEIRSFIDGQMEERKQLAEINKPKKKDFSLGYGE